MNCLDTSTSVTSYNIASSLTLHSCPPKLHFQVMVYLGAARVNKIFGCVSFIKDLLSQSLVTWNDYSVIKPLRPFVIHMKAVKLGITLGQPSLYVGHTNILLLSGIDFPSKG
jgi:hypothetical protein